jgi:uncharacterized protein (DUF3084 family)
MFKGWKHTREQLTSLKIQYYRTAQELADSVKQIDSLKQEITGFKKSNAELSKQKQVLEEKVINLAKEKQIIEAKLHSLRELKRAIRQVKIEMHDQGIQQYLARKEQQETLDAQGLAMGNRGFLLKGGQPTYKPTIRIEVKPVN